MSRYIEETIALRRELHRIPETGFCEYKTQKLLLDRLASLPQKRIKITTWRTGILVKITGNNPKKCIGYRCDMDALSIHEELNVPFRSVHNGYMHACGHDMHMAIAMGIIHYFLENEIENDIVVIFQPAEEGPGGALPLLNSEEFKDYRPDIIFALHVAPSLPVGTVATRPGILFANTSELFIQLKGKGGHAAYPHLSNDMVVSASHLTSQLHTIVSRNLSPLDSGVITIGEIHAGTRQNIISETAELKGTIRSLSQYSMNTMKKRIEEIVSGIEHGFQCSITIDYGAQYCQVTNHKEITLPFIEWVKQTSYTLHECDVSMAGEDFGYFLQKIPGMMFWLGVNTPYPLHHPKMEPDEGAIEVALQIMTNYIPKL